MSTSRLTPRELPQVDANDSATWFSGWWHGIAVGTVIGATFGLLFALENLGRL